jgi:hypothetical protein
MLGHDDRPACPVCTEPLRDIEFIHLGSQQSLAAASGPFRQRLALFCGHRVEVLIDRFSLTLQPIENA